MHARLLSASRTGLVLATSGKPVAMHAMPASGARVIWQAEPGVVGSLTECEKGWCLFDVTGRKGYISVADIWGDEPLK
mgnify:FL=1